jgi:hypothetical protein
MRQITLRENKRTVATKKRTMKIEYLKQIGLNNIYLFYLDMTWLNQPAYLLFATNIG